jgi:hypothetical protein
MDSTVKTLLLGIVGGMIAVTAAVRFPGLYRSIGLFPSAFTIPTPPSGNMPAAMPGMTSGM